ncbi:MAG: class I SAM-dependent methyltransferase [Pseudomonadota bacterium]
MTDEPKDPALARWDTYWQHGFLTSCADAFQGNYAGSIAAHWHDAFSALADDAQILDVCTGNGAVAALAARAAIDRGVAHRVTGIDLAAIRPAEALADDPEVLARIDFRSRTSADATGLADHSVDLAVGQYALEYTPLATTLPELARVVRPGGGLNFILHDLQSVVLATTREELSHRDRLAGPDGIFGAALALGRIVGEARTAGQTAALAQDPRAETSRRWLNTEAARLTEAARQSPHPEILLTVLDYAKRIYEAMAGGNTDGGRALAERARREIAANFARLDDLVDAASSVADKAELAARLGETGFDVEEPSALRHDNLLIGWSFTATRRES